MLAAGRGRPRAGDVARLLSGCDDVVLDLEITPDRGYAMSMRGVARELATALGVPFRDPAGPPLPACDGEPAYAVTVDDPAGCDRFSMLAPSSGLDPAAPSPLGLRRRLRRVRHAQRSPSPSTSPTT